MTVQAIPAAIIGQTRVAGEAVQPVYDPASEEVIAQLQEADAAIVDQAVQSAVAGYAEWRQVSVEGRQKVLRQMADLIEANADELADLETSNTGIPIAQANGRHVKRAAHNFRFFADYIGQAEGQLYEQDPAFLTLVRRESVGVAGLIAPWNAPIALGGMKIAAAIAFGNACVIKPSEQASLGVTRLVEVLQGADAPTGVINLVNGRGTVTGQALVVHPQVDRVSFTGGTTTGKAIMSAAGAHLKPCTMELGGKSANIIFESADFETALDGALLGIFTNNGQQCLAGSRILVQRSIADRFVEAFVERAKKLRIDHPRSAGVELGPLASAPHRDRVLSFAEKAKAEGAKVLLGGGRSGKFDRGYYIDPIIIAAPSNDISACQDEIFGPFASILTFETPEEAYALANATKFGLVSYVWTQDLMLAMEAQERLESGVVWVNTPMMRELRAPFGGFKESGVGAEGGRACEQFYTREKTVTIRKSRAPLQRLGLG